MKMIAQQAQGVDLPIRLGARLAQGFEEPLSIRVTCLPTGRSRKMGSRRFPRFITW
jgi:hypothetical protein